ncbi:PepSY domain-containing protein [Pseudoruegeria sp. SHC-113]|uniref:PepSY domain-containing protein n=1 Tax=Pseudoruegeria sp. SHC-113 TaxID=2855439 RepID=UPI0021BB474C|nr:PepSY domain-containing protein [Pseudoruegeria sp. SHC-113]MCT8159707.1 PepSY domain-containing protein [Pseudoruegeria sp. SHC-113]
MTFLQKSIIAAASGLAILPIAAVAQLTAGDPVGMTDAEIRAKIEAAGYTVLEIEREDGEIEVEAERDGITWEIELSDVDGTILEIEEDD